jgi:HAD superfamily phosphatase (TIGR01668 family)
MCRKHAQEWRLNMLRRFYPKRLAETSYVIDYEKLYKEGYRGVLFDIDNTLVEHGADASKRAIELFERLKQIGFQTCLISNNSDARVRRFNQKIGANYIFKANKPARKNYIKATKIMGTKIENTIFVGDQLFTDVFGANRIGMMTYLVKPIHPKEEIQIVLKRKFERIVLYFYRKDLAKGKIKQE